MTHPLTLAAFRALAPDDGAGGGGAFDDAPSVPETEEYDPFDDASDEEEEAPEASDFPDDDPDEEDDDFDFDDEEEDEDDDEFGYEADPVPSDPAEIHAAIEQAYPAVRLFNALEADLMDPESAGDTLRWFVDEIAAHHGTTAEALLGHGPSDVGDWRSRGFDSPEAYAAAPDYERAGYDSPGELALSRELAELKASLRPLAEAQARERESRARADWEGAIASIAPMAIAAVRAEVGWEATPAQVMAAARSFPELASRPGGLAEAVLATHVRDIAKASVRRGRGERPAMPEMPQGSRRQGARRVDPAEEGWDRFAAAIAEQY